MRHILVFFCASLGLAQSGADILLSEMPGFVYQALELNDGRFAVSFQGDVSDYSHAVGLFQRHGKLVSWLVPKSKGETGAGKLKRLGGMAQDANGRIWLADADQFRLHQFLPDGSLSGTTLLQAPSLAAHWLDFSTDGKSIYLGGCLPKDRGPYLGCRGLLHRRSINPPSKTISFISSERQPGWNQSDRAHYRLSDESIAKISAEGGELIAYTNFSARKIWFVNSETGRDLEISLDSYMPSLPKLTTWQEAQQAYLGQPILTRLIALKSLVYAFIKNQNANQPTLLELSSTGKVLRSWRSDALPGILVGRKGTDQLIFAFGNRLRCIRPDEIGKRK